MVNRILQFIKQHGLISHGDTLIVALSGGPDSVCLLHVLYALRKELGITLHAAHLNHSLRGDESEEDCRYVSDLTSTLDIPLTTQRANVAQYKRTMNYSLEEAAREVRYAFLANVLTDTGAKSIVTGHTRDDQVETILMNIIRGSGTRGLRGLQPSSTMITTESKTPVNVIRPLISVSRADTEEYCLTNGLLPRQDSSNQSMDFLRNRVRLELIPFLKKYNNRIDDALLRLAAISGDDCKFITEQSDEIWHRAAHPQENSVYLDLPLLLSLPRTLQRNTMANALSHMLGSLYDIEFTHIESMVELLQKPAGKTLHLPEGLVMVKEYDRLVLSRESSSSCPFLPLPDTYTMNIPGHCTIPGWKIDAEIIDRPVDMNSYNRFTALLDPEKTSSQLIIRTRRPGDRFHPLGMKAPKKLQDFMVDMKIPRAWRERIPLVCSENTILWVAGWRIDDRVKVGPSSTSALKIQFDRIPPCE